MNHVKNNWNIFCNIKCLNVWNNQKTRKVLNLQRCSNGSIHCLTTCFNSLNKESTEVKVICQLLIEGQAGDTPKSAGLWCKCKRSFRNRRAVSAEGFYSLDFSLFCVFPQHCTLCPLSSVSEITFSLSHLYSFIVFHHKPLWLFLDTPTQTQILKTEATLEVITVNSTLLTGNYEWMQIYSLMQTFVTQPTFFPSLILIICLLVLDAKTNRKGKMAGGESNFLSA